MSSITINGYAPDTMAQLPEVRTFQMNGGIGDISKSINLFRGDVNLPLELISLPGRGDLDVKITLMYQSNIHNEVDIWNLEAPTGILGLGWTLPYEMITINNKGTAEIFDDEYYLVSGGTACRLYKSNIAEDGAWCYETEDYKPWIIRYYKEAERWVIIKENGVMQSYGGNKECHVENGHIQWGVKWGGRNGNWIDSSTNLSGQEPFPLAWNLAEICNTWGEKVLFEYEMDCERIGISGCSYTKACYLKRITALDG